MVIPANFKGRAARLDDLDLPRVGATIGVGEDEIHAVLDVESRGSGFDKQGRPLILFEPHIFWRLLKGEARLRAVKAALAYEVWGAKPYPADSYPRLIAAMQIDETAALKSCSWGLGQILGTNYKAAGYTSVQAMVADFCEDEAAHLAAMVRFIKSAGLDRALRAHDWAAFARGYNGPGYAKHEYHLRLARAYARWSKIRDTPWTPAGAAVETANHDPVPHVVVMPEEPPVPVTVPRPRPAPPPPAPPREAMPAPDAQPAAPAPAAPGFWARFFSALSRRFG